MPDVPPPTNPDSASFLDRRIPHLIAGYLAAGWAVVEATAFFVERYRWPDWTLDGLILVLLAGFLPSLILTWRHGLPGAQRWTRSELGLSLVTFCLVFSAGYSAGLDQMPRGRAHRSQELRGTAGTRTIGQIRAKRQSLGKVIRLLAKFSSAGASIAADAEDLEVSLDLNDAPLAEALGVLARQTGTEIQLVGNVIEVRAGRGQIPSAPAVPATP